MAQPTGGDLHVSRPLTNISIAYIQDNANTFIASSVFPPVPSDFQFDQYYIYNKGDWFRTAAQRRAPRTESAGSGWQTSTDTFRCEVDAVHTDIADQDRANQDSAFNLDRDATVFVTRDMLLRREKDWVSKFFGTSKWTHADQTGVPSGTPSTNQFLRWNVTAATPMEDIEEQRIDMAETTGYAPNVLVLGARTHSALKNSGELIDRIKYTQRGMVTDELMAAAFEVDRVLVPMAIENTAEEGASPDTTMAFLYGKAALLCYAAPNPGKMIPSAGYTFEWTGYVGAAERGARIKRFRMEHLAADRVEAEHAYDHKQVCADLGVYFDQAVD